MDFMQLYSDAPLTQGELVSITAMVEYLAFKKGKKSEGAYCHLATEFGVEEVKHIKRRDFDRAIKFLTDQDFNLVREH